MTQKRFILVTTSLWLLIHAVIWITVSNLEPRRYPFPTNVPMLKYWDATHYSTIATVGYFANLWSFYPLYPLIIRIALWVTAFQVRPEVLGTVISTLLFAAFCLWQMRIAGAASELEGLVARSRWAWIFFLCSPGSWVFHSHHTEAIFLLLSFFAFISSRKGNWKLAAVMAGLCALTRNQGIFVAIAVALDSSWRMGRWSQRLVIFSASGLISALLFALYPLYQFIKIGDPLAFFHTHQAWGVVASVHSFLGTLWFANPWQAIDWMTISHLLFFIAINAAALGLLWKRQVPLAIYVFLSEWIQPWQGHLLNAFRFGVVLFPALFLLGDSVGKLPRWLRYTIAMLYLALNLIYARKYALGEWAY